MLANFSIFPCIAFGGMPMMPMMSMPMMVVVGLTMLISFLVSNMLKRRFQQYSEIPMPMTGAEIAEKMLSDYGINDVRVISVPGQLTDHYDPSSKTVNLSEPVYGMNSVAAAAVAAHECGHAVQHHQAYAWLTMRSKLVPVVQISSKILNYVMILAFVGSIASSPAFLWGYVILFGATTAFSLVTLPVEFDASNRAMKWMEASGIATSIESDRARNALFWAAMTYVVAALGSLAQLLIFVMRALGASRRNHE